MSLRFPLGVNVKTDLQVKVIPSLFLFHDGKMIINEFFSSRSTLRAMYRFEMSKWWNLYWPG